MSHTSSSAASADDHREASVAPMNVVEIEHLKARPSKSVRLPKRGKAMVVTQRDEEVAERRQELS